MILMIICAAASAMALIAGLISSKRYKGKPLSEGISECGIFSMLLPSVLGIAACCLCLISGAYAWFTVNITAPAQTVRGASYDVLAQIYDAENQEVNPGGDGAYLLSPKTEGKGYIVTLKAVGTASTGYCRISIGDEFLYTEQIGMDESISFTLYPSEESGSYSFEAVWGTYSGEAEITDGATFGEPWTAEPDEQSDENGSEGDEIPANGEETPNGSEETPSSGEETSASGEETLNSSEEAPSSGEETSASGEETLNSSEEAPSSGEETPSSGEETLNSSEEAPSSAEETPASGEKTSNGSEETPSSGEETTSGGEEIPNGGEDTMNGSVEPSVSEEASVGETTVTDPQSETEEQTAAEEGTEETSPGSAPLPDEGGSV